MLRFIRWLSFILLGVVVVAWGVVWLGERDPDGAAGRLLRTATAWATGQGASEAGAGLPAGLSLGGPFTLVDSSGSTVTDQSFHGRWMLLYFGYTYCPDVCPTELQTIAAALDKLGPKAGQIAPLFVTIDPARDTPSVIGQYVKLFDNRIVGLTGSPSQIADIARAYRVYYAKAASGNAGDYLMDHSSFLYLVDPQGRFRALFQPGLSAEALAAGIERDMKGTS